jgi:hypothetical protein
MREDEMVVPKLINVGIGTMFMKNVSTYTHLSSAEDCGVRELENLTSQDDSLLRSNIGLQPPESRKRCKFTGRVLNMADVYVIPFGGAQIQPVEGGTYGGRGVGR